MTIINITKENEFIKFFVDEKEKPILFNCKTYEMTSYTGRKVKHPCPVFSQYGNGYTPIDKICNCIKGIMNQDSSWRDLETYKRELSSIEPFIPYLDKVDNFPSQCPAGYLASIKEKDLTISRHSLNQFLFSKKIKNFNENDRKDLLEISINTREYENLNNFSIDKLKILIKIYRISKKTFSWNFAGDCGKFIINLNIANSFEWCDTNRDFAYNNNSYTILTNSILNEQIAKEESKYLFIETIETDNYCIKVPTSIAELEDEGKQQHNCIGYCYNRDICDGLDIIYFIRHKKNPKKSNTTCRYNLSRNETAENRIRNNCAVTNKEVLELIEKVDEAINNRGREE